MTNTRIFTVQVFTPKLSAISSPDFSARTARPMRESSRLSTAKSEANATVQMR